MASNPNSLGEIAIEITGDYSQLSDDLQKSIIAAELGGEKIASAFNEGAASVDQWADSLQSAKAATQAEVEALGAAADAASKYGSAIDDVLGPERDQLDILAQIPKSYTEMSAAQQRHVDQLNQEVTAQEQARDSLAKLTDGTISWGSALKLVGIDLSARGLLDFAKNALEAFDTIQRGSIALEHLTGSAAAGQAALRDVINVAQDDALSLPQVLQAEQRFLAFGVAADAIPGALRSIADAAAATGRGFDGIANTFERIVESGAVQSRTLVNLGINLADLAKALNVTQSEAKDAFKALDQEERIGALNAALQKFRGTAEEVADTVGGQWQRLANDFELTSARIGNALSDPAKVLISAARSMLQGVNEEIGNWAKVWRDTVIVVGEVTGKDVGAMKDSLDGLIAKMQQSDESASTSSTAFQKAWADSTGALSAGAQTLIAKQQDLDNAAIKAYNTWQDLIKAQRDGLASVQDVTRAQSDYEKALDASTPKTKEMKDAVKDLAAEYKNFDGNLKSVNSSIGTLLEYTDNLNGATRTLIGTVKEQGDAFANYVHEATNAASGYGNAARELLKTQSDLEQKANDAAVAWNQLAAGYERGEVDQVALQKALENLSGALTKAGINADDLNVELKNVGDTIPVMVGGTEKLQTTGAAWSKEIDGINAQLNTLRGNAGVFDIHTSKVDQTRDAYGMLKVTADDALKTISEDTQEALKYTQDFVQWVGSANQSFKDFASSVGSFGSQLGILDSSVGGKGSSRGGRAGSTNAQGDFNTGFSLPPHTHLDYSEWGIFGARVVPDTGWYYDLDGNLVQFDPNTISKQAATTTAPNPAVVVPTAPVATPPAAALPPQVQALISQGATLDQIATGIPSLSTNIGNLTTTTETLSSSFASMTPVLQSATTQITQSIQQQAASFSRLSEALAPLASPQIQTGGGTPASFSRPGTPTPIGTVMGSSSVTIGSINATPDEQTLLNSLMDSLQRRGIRF